MTQESDGPRQGKEKWFPPSTLDGVHKATVTVAASLTSLGIIVSAAVFVSGHLAKQSDVEDVRKQLVCAEARANFADVRVQAAAEYTRYINAKFNDMNPKYLEDRDEISAREDPDFVWGIVEALEAYAIPEALKEQRRACQEDDREEDS